jgi:hypothetical protein
VGGKGGGGGRWEKWTKPCMHIWIIKEKKWLSLAFQSFFSCLIEKNETIKS